MSSPVQKLHLFNQALWNLCHRSTLNTSIMLCQNQIKPNIITDAVYTWYSIQMPNQLLTYSTCLSLLTTGLEEEFFFFHWCLQFEQSLERRQLHEQVYGLFLIASRIMHLIAVHL